MPPVHDSARRKREPSRAAEIEDDLGDRALVFTEQVGRECFAHRVGDLRAALLGRGLDEEVHVDLELACTDRHVHPLPLAASGSQRLGDGRLGRPEESQHAVRAPRSARQNPLHRRGRERTRPEPLQLARRARKDDDDAVSGVENDAWCRSRKPQRDRPLGKRRLLAHAGRELRIRATESLGDCTRDGSDLPLECLVEEERPTGDASDELDRTVVVRRTEAARDEAEIGLEAFGERTLEILDAIAHDRDSGGVESEPHDLRGEERPVAVLPLAANELGARDDDRRPRAGQDVARMILRAVTTNVVPAGRSTRLPFTRTATLSGSASASCSERPSNAFRWPCSSVPL